MNILLLMMNIKRVILLILILNSFITSISICNDDECNINDEQILIKQWIYEHYANPVLLSTRVNDKPIDLKFPVLDQVI